MSRLLGGSSSSCPCIRGGVQLLEVQQKQARCTAMPLRRRESQEACPSLRTFGADRRMLRGMIKSKRENPKERKKERKKEEEKKKETLNCFVE